MRNLRIVFAILLLAGLSGSCIVKEWLGIKSAPEGLAVYSDGWAAMESDGARPDWVNEGWEATRFSGERGVIFLSTGTAPTMQAAKSQAENFARLESEDSLIDYLNDELAMEISDTDALWALSWQNAGEFWEKGYTVDPETEKPIDDEIGPDNPIYRYYIGVFLSDEQLESIDS